MNRDKKYIGGIVALFLAAFAWGSAYTVMKSNLEIFPAMWLLGIRFAIAGALMAVICLPKWKELDKQTVCHGVWMGILLYMEFFFFTVGIQYTTASRSAFVVAAYIIFVPGAYWLVFRKRPGKLDVAASVTCLLGAAIILLDSAGGGINKGDLLTVGSSLFYAVHVMYGSVYAKQHSPLLLNMLQIGTAGIIGLAAAFLTTPFPTGVQFADFGGAIYLAVGSTIIPYLLSLVGQRYVRPTTSAVILSFESVFGCLASVLVLGDRLTPRFVLGAAVVLFSFFVAEGIVPGIRK